MQKRFVEEYMVDRNGTRAAVRAGYSANSARTQASQLLKRPAIMAALGQAMALQAKEEEISSDPVVRELARVAFADIRDVVEWDDQGMVVKSSDRLAPEAGRAVAEISKRPTREGMVVKVKMHDKLAALNALARHLGMFADKQEHTGKDGGPLEVRSLFDLVKLASEAEKNGDGE